MNRIKQLPGLLTQPYCRAQSFNRRSIRNISLIIFAWIGLLSCSKDHDELLPGGKPVFSTVQFRLFASKDHNNPDDINTSAKLRLSISRVDFSRNSKTTIWDTLITRSSLLDFAHEAKPDLIEVFLPAINNPEDHLLLSYLVVYNKNGVLTTRSESERSSGKDNSRLSIAL